ncbi:MAG: serine/threonine-protein kinase, partial [Deltaproteobacteria bacterium]|nr:serine/threonine-protein kinase [Deltaproteobacteria bacterium]
MMEATVTTSPPEHGDAPTPDPGAQLGPAPAVAGGDQIRGDVHARLFGDTPTAEADASTPPSVHRIGRFRVVERLGRGGMGVVYRAYDPELDRPVAIKVLRPDVHGAGERDAQARLLREAQAMARLSDPNVIMVHEVGTVDDRVFVAMEYVEGPTLRQWMHQPRPWTTVLPVFLGAGQGLAAAHRAGLVHRDFKPDNVLIDPEDRVRVLDFGLARALEDHGTDGSTPVTPIAERPDVDSLHTPLTQTGAVMGTPAYMAPEQMLGHCADARSDQFSFCVALYEALYRQRPFAGDTLATLSMNVVRGRLREPPAEARVPGRLFTALRRGLTVDPDARFERMEDLLGALEQPPTHWWRRALVVGALGATATVAMAGLWREDATDACGGLRDQLTGVWDPARREQVRDAIEGTGRDFAPRVAQTTLGMLDTYAAGWITQAEDACGAALVGQPDDEAERRRDCLEQRRVELGALVDALAEAEEGMVHAAVTATADLTDLGACADPRRLSDQHVVDDPEVRQQLARARGQLAHAKARGALGHYDEAVELASEVIERARALGSPTLEAMGRMIRGNYRERAGDPAGAEQDLRDAVAQAQAGGDTGIR